MMENNQPASSDLERFDNKPALETLSDREIRAVQMKWEGKSARAIGKACGWANEGYVRRLFMQGGRLRPALDEFRAKQTPAEDRVKEAVETAKQEAIKSVQKLVELKDSNNPAAVFKACEKLLDLAGVGQEFQLVNYFRAKTFEQAQRIINDLFQSLYGRGLQNVTEMPTIEIGGRPLVYNIGNPDRDPGAGQQ